MVWRNVLICIAVVMTESTEGRSHQKCTHFLHWNESTDGTTEVKMAGEQSVNQSALIRRIAHGGDNVYFLETMSGYLGVDDNGRLIQTGVQCSPSTLFLPTKVVCEKNEVLKGLPGQHCKTVICARRHGDNKAFLIASPGSGKTSVIISDPNICKGQKHFKAAVNRSVMFEGGFLRNYIFDTPYLFELVGPKKYPSWLGGDLRCNCGL